LAVGVALAAIAAFLWFRLAHRPGPDESPEAPVAAEAPASWDARISALDGEVSVLPKGKTEGVPAAAGMPVAEGDEVWTASDGRAELALSADGIIELGANTQLTVSGLKGENTSFMLDLGSFVARLRWENLQKRRLEVRTPTAVAAVRGTEFGLEVQEDGETSVAVFDEGEVAVRATEAPSVEETLIQASQEVRVPRGPALEVEAREGRNFLRPRVLDEMRPLRGRVAHVRGRQEELRREWREMPPPQREQARERMFREHEERMSRLPEREREAMHERLRRPERGPGGEDGRRGPGMREDGPRGEGMRFQREDRRGPREGGMDRGGERRGPEDGDGRRGRGMKEDRQGPGRREEGRGRRNEGMEPRGDSQRGPEGEEGRRGRGRDADRQGPGMRGNDRGPDEQGMRRQGGPEREQRQAPGRREEGLGQRNEGMRPQGGQPQRPGRQEGGREPQREERRQGPGGQDGGRGQGGDDRRGPGRR
jgi:hypothetical protein